MKVTEREIDLTTLAVSSEQSASRTRGTHVSDIIGYMKRQLEKGGKFTESDLEQFGAIGRLWERVVADVLFRPPRYERIGEVEQDGIIGSPDAIDTVEWRVMEFKATWKSGSRKIEEFREYLWQVQSYCHMLGMCRATIIVLFVCGNYRPPVPYSRQFDIVFTPAELKQNWAMIQTNQVEMERT